MAHAKNARRRPKSLKKGKKMEEINPLFAKCVTGKHYSNATISVRKAA